VCGVTHIVDETGGRRGVGADVVIWEFECC
jgi:hypothetical protein